MRSALLSLLGLALARDYDWDPDRKEKDWDSDKRDKDWDPDRRDRHDERDRGDAFCQRICRETPGCLPHGSYCKADHDPATCFGLYKVGHGQGGSRDLGHHRERFCFEPATNREHRCNDQLLDPVLCGGTEPEPPVPPPRPTALPPFPPGPFPPGPFPPFPPGPFPPGPFPPFFPPFFPPVFPPVFPGDIPNNIIIPDFVPFPPFPPGPFPPFPPGPFPHGPFPR